MRTDRKPTLRVRPATPDDLAALIDLYAIARAFMRQNGNGTQWRDSHPSRALIERDIAEHTGFVLEAEGRIEGAFALLIGDDPTYAYIEDGTWRSSAPYATIHRIASAGRVQGVLRACVEWSIERCPHLRIDTHENNTAMLGALPKLGFVRCGVIYVADGTPRIAFERLPQ